MRGLTTLEGLSLNIAITIASGSGFLLFGYDQGFFGGILTNDAFLKAFNYPDSTLSGQLVALYDVGCMIGCIASMIWSDRLGRKRSILVGTTILIIGAVIQTSAYEVAQMIVGRIVAGIGTGLNTTAIPIWQAETAKASMRGSLIVFQLVSVIFGVALSNWMNFGFTFLAESDVSWRFPIAFQIFFALITMSLVVFLPESPRWLVQRGRLDDASVIIGRLYAKPSNDPVVAAEVTVLDNAVQLERAQQSGVTIREIFSGGPQQTLRRILLGCGTQFMQQIGGTNVVATYLPIVLVDSFGLSARVSLIVSACISLWLMFWGAGCALFIDRLGRFKLMLFGAAGSSICFALISVGLAVNTKSSLIMAIAFIFLYYCAYGLSFLSIPFMYPAEINSQRMRNVGCSFSTLTNWATCYLIVSVTPVGIDSIGWKYYMIFAITNAIFVPLVWFFYVETKQLSLEEIDQVFATKYAGDRKISYNQAIREVKDRRVTMEETVHKMGMDGDVERHEFAPGEKADVERHEYASS